MKKTLFIVLSIFLLNSISLSAENLLKNGDMESVGSWSVSYLNSQADDQPVAEWGYSQNIPTAATGGVLRISKSGAIATTQYCIYQKVTLSSDYLYELNAAFKVVNHSTWDQTWFECFVSTTAPVDGFDFGSGEYGIINFSVWGHPKNWDGTLKEDANGNKTYRPETSGDYYIVIKTGCNSGGNFEIMLDNVSFQAKKTPIANFDVSSRSGFAPFTVDFTSNSYLANSYEWNFGDGSTNTQQNPSHTYTTAGKYNVTLKVTNADGSDIITKEDLIEVRELQPITGGGILQGGNMQDKTKWQVTTLNSPEAQLPIATWNYAGDKMPSAGQGAALRITGSALDATSQYCIYQRVNLSSDKVYRFNAAFRDNSTNLMNFFSEVYIGQEIEPADGNDFGKDDATLLTELGVWDSNSLVRKLDGTFQIHSTVKEFIPNTSGEYFFVFKAGVVSWGGESRSFDIIIDELLLEEVRTKPYPNFTSENSRGFAPLEVQFDNSTRFATSYEWSFGDGSAKSTEQSPKHTYTNAGKYTVTLKATNEKGDSSIVKTDFIAVNDRPALPTGEKLYGGNMEDGGFWYTARIGSAVQIEQTWNYAENIPTGGEGGALRLKAVKVGGQGSNIAIYQPIKVKKDYAYTFDGLFKVIENTNQMWVQAYIISQKPQDDGEHGTMEEKSCLGQLNTWADGSVSTFDGSIRDKAVIGEDHQKSGGELLSYHHTGEDADMFFVLKIGTWEHEMDIVLDNLTLQEAVYVAKPVANFSSDMTTGNTPLTIQFFNESKNASSFEWNFGDGNTSTEEDPEHTYNQAGVYSVSLTVRNGNLSDTKTIENMITVTGESALPEIDTNSYLIYTSNNRIIMSSEVKMKNIFIFDIRGLMIEKKTINSNYFTSLELSTGIYLVNIDGKVCKVIVK